MKRWYLLFAIGWLVSMAWESHSIGAGGLVLWQYLLVCALFTSLPNLVQILIVFQLVRCGPSWPRTIGIFLLPVIGFGVAAWQVNMMYTPGSGFLPGFPDYIWGALPGIVAWFGFFFDFLFPPDLP